MSVDNQMQLTYLHSFLSYVFELGHGGPSELLLPLIKRSIVTIQKKHFSIPEIKDEIKSLFTKDFPTIVIQKEFNKLLSQNLIKISSEQYAKETKYTIVQELDSYETEYNASVKKVDFFVAELKSFIQNQHQKYSHINTSAIFKRLEEYCKKYFSGILLFLTESQELDFSDQPTLKKEFDVLIDEFIKKIKSDNSLFDGFSQIFHGVTLLNVFEKCFEFTNLDEYQLGEKVFFLDTNILLRILNFQSEDYNRAGKELYEILTQYKFQVKAFRITIDELESLIRGYKYRHVYFIKGRDISHIYQNFKDKDYLPSDVDRIIDNAHDTFKKLNIEIVEDDNIENIDHYTFEKQVDDLTAIKLAKFKKINNYSDEDITYNDDSAEKRCYNLAKHDLRLIYLIRKYRKGENRRFETTKYYVITGEGAFIRYAKEMKDIDLPGQIEVIGDAILSFLLYFKNPQNAKGISVRNFIIANFDTQHLSPKLWISYVSKVYTKFKNKEISEKTLGYLLTKTILDNDRISTLTMDAAINSSIEKFVQFENEQAALKGHTETIKETNFQLENEKASLEKQYGELANRVDIITNDKQFLVRQYNDIKQDNLTLRESLKNLRKALFIVFGIFLVISIVVIFKDPISGSILTVSTMLLNLLNLFDYFKKVIIKD